MRSRRSRTLVKSMVSSKILFNFFHDRNVKFTFGVATKGKLFFSLVTVRVYAECNTPIQDTDCSSSFSSVRWRPFAGRLSTDLLKGDSFQHSYV
ncbi:hypothetical protein RB195_020733 [Necator americanus]